MSATDPALLTFGVSLSVSVGCLAIVNRRQLAKLNARSVRFLRYAYGKRVTEKIAKASTPNTNIAPSIVSIVIGVILLIILFAHWGECASFFALAMASGLGGLQLLISLSLFIVGWLRNRGQSSHRRAGNEVPTLASAAILGSCGMFTMAMVFMVNYGP